MVQGLREGSRVLKSCLVAAERGFRQKRCHQRGSSKAAGLQRLLVMVEGELFKEIFTQPSLGTSQTAEVGQVVT